ncbi:MAG: phospholipase D family protein [Flavobacteriaceae bacterium]|nr:phospholipase D family protein [Flavobacteriaceae bacterium]
MGMFHNNVNCDIYIGKGAGKKLMHDIDNAQHSVKILSPFLSPFLVKKLIDLHHKGVSVQLITTDTIEDFYGDRKRNVHELISQHTHVDREARALRNKWKKIRRVLYWLAISLTAGMIYLVYQYNDVRTYGLIIPIILLFLGVQVLRSKIQKKGIFSYTYKQLFPFKVVISPDKFDYDGMYLHSKIYIIDDRIAYLGSLNFTGSGTKKNYETRIRLSSSEVVQKIVEEFNHLLLNEQLPELSIQDWGQQLYKEPIN